MTTWPTIHWPDPKSGPHEFALVKHPRDRARPDVDSRPWYLRPPAGHASGKAWHSLGSADLREAAAAARTFLDTWSGSSDRHTRAQAALAGPAATTIGRICEEWIAAGCPDRNERPRKPEAAARLAGVLARALPWWGAIAPATIRRETFREFARWRRSRANRNRSQTGDRVIDLELAALSCACQWAAAVETIPANPFRDRPRFRDAADVSHCNEHRPATDEELHAILAWCWRPEASDAQRVGGAHLAWCALTGQRPGEAGELRTGGTVIGDRRPPGSRWTLRDGTDRIAVVRLKNGINPAVRVHAALHDFLRAWLPFRDSRWPKSNHYFPDPSDPSRPLAGDDNDTPLNRVLDAATSALGLPHRKPHAMRAFYVRVRRSEGIDDGTIAVELGQGSGPGLVVNTYGRADDLLGDGAFDWLPEGQPPAWHLLQASATASNIIELRRAA